MSVEYKERLAGLLVGVLLCPLGRNRLESSSSWSPPLSGGEGGERPQPAQPPQLISTPSHSSYQPLIQREEVSKSANLYCREVLLMSFVLFCFSAKNYNFGCPIVG